MWPPLPQQLRVRSVALLFAFAACKGDGPAPIAIAVGGNPALTRTFQPVSVLFERIDTGRSHQLRLLLTSYPAGCDGPLPVPPGGIAVVATLVAPPKGEVGPGDYSWSGHDAHGGAPDQPERAYASVRLVTDTGTFAVPPGGGLRLEAPKTPTRQTLTGVLAFESAGDATHPAVSVRGGFVARTCELR